MNMRARGEIMESRGHLESFESLYPHLFLPSMRLAFRLTGDRALAEDLAAEALARTYARWSTVVDLSYREAWVMRVTTNLALDSMRRNKFQAKALIDLAQAHEESGRASMRFDDNTAVRLALASALRKLPRRQREVVVLRHLCEFDAGEISRVLEMSESTVRTHLQRGLSALRRGMGSDFEEVELDTD